MKERQYRMKEIISILREEYEDINASALRFWQKEGLIKPSGEETSGHHRRYREKDLDIVRFIKDLSDFGYSLNQIGKELSSVKDKIQSERIDEIEPGVYSTTYVAKILMHHRSRKRLTMRLKLYRDMDESTKYVRIYERNVLGRRIKDNTLSKFIEEVDELEITKPEKIKGKFLYSSCDEVILETLIYIIEEEKNFLDRCQDLFGTVDYLYNTMGLTARFAAGPLMSLDLSTYKALLYNLIQERFSHEEKERRKEEEEKRKKKE